MAMANDAPVTLTTTTPPAEVVPAAAAIATSPSVAELAEAAKDREEYFTQYWHYATNLRNWFIAYGVGGILLLTRADAVFNAQPHAAEVEPGLRVVAIALFIFGLATQVVLTLVNKVGHYYAYQKHVVAREGRRHRFATWLCECFWIDLVLDAITLAWYLAGTVAMARLL
jgi:hypothetical protein